MQSNNASKKNRKMSGDSLTSAAEAAASTETIATSHSSRSSKAKKTETTDVGSAKHRNSKSVELMDAAPVAHAMPVAAAVAATSSVRTAPPKEEIAKLAYSFWEARGFEHGSSEEDWLRAERELSAKQ